MRRPPCRVQTAESKNESFIQLDEIEREKKVSHDLTFSALHASSSTQEKVTELTRRYRSLSQHIAVQESRARNMQHASEACRAGFCDASACELCPSDETRVSHIQAAIMVSSATLVGTETGRPSVP